MRRSALPVVLVACVIVAAVLAWLFVQRVIFAPSEAPAGPAVADTRVVKPFTRVEVSGQLDVEIVQGDKHEVVVEAQAADQPRIRTEVSGDTLRISAGKHEFHVLGAGTLRSARVVVRAPAIQSISLAGAVRLTSPSLVVPTLRISASGATSLRIDALKVDSLRLTGSGAVKAELAGQATEQSISLSGAGSVRAPELRSESARVSVSGAGSVVVNAEKTLHVDLSGAGIVEYLGNPEVRQSVSGLGRIKRRETGETRPTRARWQVA